MAVSSANNLNAAKKELEDVNAAYHHSLEQNNELKLQIDNIIAGVNIDEVAKQLGLEKIPANKRIVVDVTPFQ